MPVGGVAFHIMEFLSDFQTSDSDASYPEKHRDICFNLKIAKLPNIT
jgi:hypothetical protein